MTRRDARIGLAPLLVAALLLTLSPAAGATKSKDRTYGEIRDDRALVYFIRAPSWGRGVDSSLFVYSGKEFLGVVQKSSYTFAYLEPGSHFLWSNAAVRERVATDLSSTREVELEAGKVYHVVLNFRVPPHVYLAVLPPAQGEEALREARFHVQAEENDVQEATALAAERFHWMGELDQRRDAPEEVVWRMPQAEGAQVICSLIRIFVDDVKVSETGTMKNVADAEDFQRALKKKLRKRGYDTVATVGQADAVIESTVGKIRTETLKGFKYVSSARVSLRTLEGQEMWVTLVDNATPFTASAFRTWADLAKKAVSQMQAACPQN